MSAISQYTQSSALVFFRPSLLIQNCNIGTPTDLAGRCETEYKKEKQMKNIEYNSNLHTKLIEVGKKIETSLTHKLEPQMIDGIVQTLIYCGINGEQQACLSYDLYIAKYKIFDWLGMWYTGRCACSDQSATKAIHVVIEKMVKHYVAMEHVGGWAWSFRGHIDMDCVTDEILEEKCADCIESYEYWHNQTKDERNREYEELVAAFDGNVIDL